MNQHDRIIGQDINEAVRYACGFVLQNGVMYQSSEQSMNAGNPIKEVFNSTMCWKQPRRRIYTTMVGTTPYRMGLAVARFFYLLSGSNYLAPISFYSASVSRFSDDGITIPGSSYGHRIFGDDGTGGQFERVAETIRQRPDTKRGQIAVYGETDAGRISHDIPCVSALTFMPRGDTLHMTLQMRANDALKLLPYNLFEFSLLMECMSAQTGLKLGELHHTAVSLHLRGAEMNNLAPYEDCQFSVAMQPITTFSNQIRLQLVWIEKQIRTEIAHKGAQAAWEWFNMLSGLQGVWYDLVGVLLLESLRCVQTKPDEIVALQQKMVSILPEAAAIPAFSLTV